MKKRPLFLCMSTLMCALCMPFNELSAQTTKWDYPVKPGTPQWAAFKSHREMVEACQIPEGVLNSLTTAELVEICLNYPLFGDVMFYDSSPLGFRFVSQSFNGMQELFRRKDNVQYLLETLKKQDLLTMSNAVSLPVEVGKSIWHHSFIELLLSHELVLANANTLQQKEIAVAAMRNVAIKEYQNHLHGQSSLETSAYLLGATLTKLNGGAALSPAMDKFLENGLSQDISVITEELKRKF